MGKMRGSEIRRFRSALINNVVDDNLESLKKNEAELGSLEFGRLESTLMCSAFNNASDKCIEYFLSIGFSLSKDGIRFLETCKLEKIIEVYNILEKYYGNSPRKEVVAHRLLQPHKIDDNPNRLDFISSLLESGFLSHDVALKTINENFVSDQKKGKVISLLRDMKLMKLGI